MILSDWGWVIKVFFFFTEVLYFEKKRAVAYMSFIYSHVTEYEFVNISTTTGLNRLPTSFIMLEIFSFKGQGSRKTLNTLYETYRRSVKGQKWGQSRRSHDVEESCLVFSLTWGSDQSVFNWNQPVFLNWQPIHHGQRMQLRHTVERLSGNCYLYSVDWFNELESAFVGSQNVWIGSGM